MGLVLGLRESRTFLCVALAVFFINFLQDAQGIDLERYDGLYKNKDKTATLSCLITDADDHYNYTIEWTKDGADLRQNASFKMHMEGKLGILTIEAVDARKLGMYLCKVTDPVTGSPVTANPVLEAEPVVEIELGKDEKSLTRNIGQMITIVCHVFSYPRPTTVMWRRGDENLTDHQNITIDGENGHSVTTKLTLFDLEVEDRGDYECVAETSLNNHTVVTHSTSVLLRVKDPMSALWPFIGIVAEILVLAIIIIIYEVQKKKKQKQKENRNGAEQRLISENASNSPDGGKDLRHRKA